MLSSKLKKLGVVAMATLAAVASTGANTASMNPLMMGDIGQGNPANRITNFGLLTNKNINIGSYQAGGDVSITNNSGLGTASPKLGVDSLVKKYETTPSLGLDSMVSKAMSESAQKQKFDSDVDAAFAVANGRRSPYGSVGCAETVTFAGSYYNHDLKEAFYQGIAYVPSLLSKLSAKGYAIEPFNGFANKGDLLVYGDDDHITISDGVGGCLGNSSSRLRAMHYSDASSAWNYGEMPSKIVRMS